MSNCFDCNNTGIDKDFQSACHCVPLVSATSMRTKVEARQAAKATTAPAATTKSVTVPSGHYAIVVDGVVKFYRVNSPTEGKWAGYTFVDAQASDDFYKVSRDGAKPILAAIAADIKGALVRYGHELGVCGVCRRTLTDEASRAAGIGPICAGRLG